jgi:hypothetical protein
MRVSREEFAQAVTEQLRALGETRSIRFDEGRERLVVGAGDELTHFVFLQHGYRECSVAPQGLAGRSVLARIWAIPLGAPDAGQSRGRLLSRVVPRIRDRAWFSAIRRQAELELGSDETSIEELMLPFQPLNQELAMHLATELPTSLSEISNDRLDAWGLTFEELYEHAVRNLRERSQRAFDESEAGLFVSPYRDSLDASRMVLTDLIEALPVKGRPVVIAPTHDALLVAGDEDPIALQQLAAKAEEALAGPRVNSAITFRLEAGVWVPWLPERGNPAWGRLRILQLQSTAAMYARQREVLSALLRANEHDIVVMPLRVLRTAQGDIVTTTVWTDGQDALLPKTDRLEFVRLPPDGNPLRAETWSTRWDVAQRLVGHLMQSTGDIPERFRVSEFPEDQVLDQLEEQGQL